MRATPCFSARAFSRANCELSRLSTAAPPGSSAGEDFGLGVGDRLDAGEEFQMHRLDRGDDGDMRPHHLDQRLDLARMVHADLEHGKARCGRAARQRQRHAPMIVEGRGRGMGLALRRQHAAQRFLGRGLADRAGDGDHLPLQPRARGAARDRARRRARRRRSSSGASAANLSRCARSTTASAAPAFSAAATKSWPSCDVALDGEIGLARLDGAAVDGKTDDAVRQRAIGRGAHRLRHRLRCPEQARAHATLGASAAATAS